MERLTCPHSRISVMHARHSSKRRDRLQLDGSDSRENSELEREIRRDLENLTLFKAKNTSKSMCKLTKTDNLGLDRLEKFQAMEVSHLLDSRELVSLTRQLQDSHVEDSFLGFSRINESYQGWMCWLKRD